MLLAGRGSRGSRLVLLVCGASRLVMERSWIGACLLGRGGGGLVVEGLCFGRGRS